MTYPIKNATYLHLPTAEFIAKKLTEKRRKQIDDLEKEASDLIYSYYLKQLPFVVADAFHKHKNFFMTRSDIRHDGNGFPPYSFTGCPKGKTVIVNDFNREECTIELNKQQANELKWIKNKIKTLTEEYDSLNTKIKNAVLQCRTLKRLQETFPEAAAVCPEKEYSAPAIKIEDIRNQLKKQ